MKPVMPFGRYVPIVAAAALAASLAAVAQVPPTDRIHREPANPSLILSDGRGNNAVALQFDGIRLFGPATLSFSPHTAMPMSVPVGSQAGWATVRVGNDFYFIPLYAPLVQEAPVTPAR